MSGVGRVAEHPVFRLAVVLPLAALLLAGCKTTSSSSSTLFGDSSAEYAPANGGQPSLGEVAQWGKRWEANQGDADTTIGYVSRLRAIGSDTRAMTVLEDAAQVNPSSTRIQGEYGKQLARSGKNQRASEVLQRAAAAPDSNWQVHSTKGVVLDRLGRHGDAQAAYQVALQKSPGQVTALNNLGLSQAQNGDLKAAEQSLRQAYETPAGKSHPQLRQNLALVVGLQGRFDEAKEIVKGDLPPQQVEENIAYLRQMLSQPDPWKKLSTLDKKNT